MLHIRKEHYIFLSVVTIITIAVVAGHLWLFQDDNRIVGQIEVSEFQIRAHQDIRILEVRVKEGDYVSIGDTLIVFENLKSETSHANVIKNISDSNQIKNKSKEIRETFRMWQQAKADEEATSKIYRQAQQQFNDGKISDEERDKAFIDYKAYQAHEQATRHLYENTIAQEMSQDGPCGFKTCENAVIAEVEGEIGTVGIKKGEIVRTDTFMLYIAMLDNPWGVFILNPKEAQSFHKEDTLMVYCSPFKEYIPMKIMHIVPKPQTKRSNDNEDKNYMMYELKAYPTRYSEGLRPGMLLSIDKEKSILNGMNFNKKGNYYVETQD